MIFEKALVHGLTMIKAEERRDDRGFFARLFCEIEFANQGLETRFVQENVSLSIGKGTLRGMHYQVGAAAEVKIVRCTAGALYDVALDLRPDSPSFGHSFGMELSAENHTMLYIPRGCAHGFISLAPNTEICYLVSSPYAPEMERGIRYNDPQFSIRWPVEVKHISVADASRPLFNPETHSIDQLRGFI